MPASTPHNATSQPRLSVGSTFTGVGGADLGFEEAGFEIAWQCELDPWKRSVLAAHWPDVPIYDDITTLHDPPSVDVLIGGFPCQDLSIAGKRKGFDGERSVLAFEFLRLAESLKPRWLVLENVPGLLSSNKGLDFQRLLNEVVACGYGVAWRCLDARYFGVPQRRRRIFIVARRAETGLSPRDASGLALLALSESGSGDSTSCIPSWQETAGGVGEGVDDGRVGTHGAVSDEPTGTLARMYSEQSGQDYGGGAGVIAYRKSARVSNPGTPETWVDDGVSNTLNRFDVGDVRSTHLVVPVQNTVIGRADTSGPNGPGHGAVGGPMFTLDRSGPHAVVAFSHTQGLHEQASEEVWPTLRRNGGGQSVMQKVFPIDDGQEIEKHQNGTGVGGADDPAYTLDRQQRPAVAQVSPTLTKYNLDSRSPQSEEQQRIVRAVHESTMSVRRLTPIECERLMGWPDNWTAPEGVKASDSKRYAACGDGIVANVALWIADRIRMIEEGEL